MSRYALQNSTDRPESQVTASELAGGVTQYRPSSGQGGGMYRRLVNGETRRGYPECRRGTRPAGWLQRLVGDARVALGPVQAAVWFRPLRRDLVTALPGLLLVIAGDDLWGCRENNEPELLEAGITAGGQLCEIIPAVSEALILRGLAETPVLFEPYGLRYGRTGARKLPAPPAGSGRVTLPPATTGCWAGNRVWLKFGIDQVIASDALEYDYQTTNVLDAEGGSGAIVRLWPYAQDSLLVFKTDAVVQFTGIHAPANVVAQRVYGALGCIAPRSIAQAGANLFYLSARGVERLMLGNDNQLVQAGAEFSAPVARQIDALDAAAAAQAVGVVFDGYYLLDIPSKATLPQVDALGQLYDGTTIVSSDLGGVWNPGMGRGLVFPTTFPIVFST